MICSCELSLWASCSSSWQLRVCPHIISLAALSIMSLLHEVAVPPSCGEGSSDGRVGLMVQRLRNVSDCVCIMLNDQGLSQTVNTQASLLPMCCMSGLDFKVP